MELGHAAVGFVRGHDATGAQGVSLSGDTRKKRTRIPRRAKHTSHGPRPMCTGQFITHRLKYYVVLLLSVRPLATHSILRPFSSYVGSITTRFDSCAVLVCGRLRFQHI